MLKSGITSVAAKEVENPQDYGVFRVDGDMVRGVVEKAENPPSNLANVGCYVFKTDIFDRIDATEPNPKRGEVEITDTLQSMVEEMLPIRCFPVREWNELGKPWDVLNLTEIYLRGLVQMTDPESTIDGLIDRGVHVGAGTIIESGSRVIEPCIIGDNCLIRGGTIVGPNSTIGEGSTLDGCTVEGSVLMDGCRVDSGSRIEHSVLASGVVVESGASLLSGRPDGKPIMLDIKGRPTDSGRTRLGSIVGDSCRIGAGFKLGPGTLLEPDTVVPDKASGK
jgi:bifunctional UDP-N-acetylglucosamine pyrophosphorylase/glucosamine-1-phosphate N-acetyltransferase